jgi:hypothetical protein
MSQEELTFTRNKSVTVRPANGGITVFARMSDSVHEMEVELDVSVPDMVITDIRARMIRVPHEECRRAQATVKGAVGLEIKKGLSLLMEETVGGKAGCTHMTNLVMEACYNAIPGQYIVIRRIVGDILDEMTPAERAKWFIAMRPQMIDSCVAYATDSPLIVEARRTPESGRVKELMERLSAANRGAKKGRK